MCNPAFPLAEHYIKMLEAAKEAEPVKTKALLILPEQETEEWFVSFIGRNKWRVLRRYVKGVKLFSEPSHANGFSVKRRQPVASMQNIVAFELKTPKKETCEELTLREELTSCADFVKYGYKPPARTEVKRPVQP